jgi:hypothetical protein
MRNGEPYQHGRVADKRGTIEIKRRQGDNA